MAAVAPLCPRSRPVTGTVRLRRGFQRSFFCACGRPLESRLAVCRSCASGQSHSRRYFGGNREAVLERDGRRCRTCGEADWLQVHHRRPGRHARKWLITLCARCHARVHRLQALHYWLPEPLVLFWAEQHPAGPRQLQFALAAKSA